MKKEQATQREMICKNCKYSTGQACGKHDPDPTPNPRFDKYDWCWGWEDWQSPPEDENEEWNQWEKEANASLFGRYKEVVALGDPYELIRCLINNNAGHFISNIPCPPGWDENGWPWNCMSQVIDIPKARRQFEDKLRKMPEHEQIEVMWGSGLRWPLKD